MKRLAVTFVVLAWLAPGTASAVGSWRTVDDAAAGFSIAVPGTWRLVPHSTPALARLVHRLATEKRTALATQYAEILAARRVRNSADFRFQAFPWPAPKGAVVPDVTVKIDPLRRGTRPSALPLIARQIAKALSRSKAAGVATTVRRVLPGGTAYVVTGTTRLSRTTRSRYAVYLLIHGRRLYSISFRGPATAAETRIVESLRFV
jgi:hypothetical protein